MRTSFEWEGLGEPIQVIHPDCVLSVREYLWQNNSEIEVKTRLDTFLVADRQAGFDFTQAPLLRATLIMITETLDDKEIICGYHIILTCHHICLDGWSIAVLFRELSLIYSAYLENQPLRLTHAGSFTRLYSMDQKTEFYGNRVFLARNTLQVFILQPPRKSYRC